MRPGNGTRHGTAVRPSGARLVVSSCPPAGTHPVEDLPRLFERIVEAKAEHRRQLGRRLNPVRIELTRATTLAALEDYVGALSRYGIPVPPPLHRDLQLLRGLGGGSRTSLREGP